MSVNNLAPTDPPTLYQNEQALTPGYVTELELRVPATIAGPKRVELAKGKIWVTSERIIFLTSPTSGSASSSSNSTYDAPPVLQSLSIPYSCIKETSFNLPLFTPNNLVISFIPDSTPGITSGLPDPGRGGKIEVKLVIGEGVGHSIWKRIESERETWLQRKRDEDTLPLYTPN